MNKNTHTERHCSPMVPTLDNPPVVSICTITYNHAPYIRECIEGVLMQQTTFPIEFLIHDDASIDGTADIIRTYAAQYPGIIIPILQTENQYSQRKPILATHVFPRVRGEYIALCEGDDYWTDSLKLQKQVDYLKAHPQIPFCCHRFVIFDQANNQYLKEYADSYYQDQDLVIDNALFSKVWVTQPLSTVIRTESLWQAVKEMESKQYSTLRDVFLFYSLLKQGNGISLNESMGVYRWHEAGIASLLKPEQKFANGYRMYGEIYAKNATDQHLKAKFFYNLIGYLRYGKARSIKNNLHLLKEGYPLCTSLRDKINLLVSFAIPRAIFNPLSYIYLKMKWSSKQKN